MLKWVKGPKPGGHVLFLYPGGTVYSYTYNKVIQINFQYLVCPLYVL
jgi:hypothetical protein